MLGIRSGARIKAIEAEHGRGFADLVLADPPQEWPSWLTRAVASVTAADFSIGSEDLEGCLDLLAIAKAPGTAGRP